MSQGVPTQLRFIPEQEGKQGRGWSCPTRASCFPCSPSLVCVDPCQSVCPESRWCKSLRKKSSGWEGHLYKVLLLGILHRLLRVVTSSLNSQDGKEDHTVALCVQWLYITTAEEQGCVCVCVYLLALVRAFTYAPVYTCVLRPDTALMPRLHFLVLTEPSSSTRIN